MLRECFSRLFINLSFTPTLFLKCLASHCDPPTWLERFGCSATEGLGTWSWFTFKSVLIDKSFVTSNVFNHRVDRRTITLLNIVTQAFIFIPYLNVLSIESSCFWVCVQKVCWILAVFLCLPSLSLHWSNWTNWRNKSGWTLCFTLQSNIDKFVTNFFRFHNFLFHQFIVIGDWR